MNNYFRNFTNVALSAADINTIKGIMHEHRDNHVLDYHGYLDLRTTLRTSLAQQLKEFATTIGLKVAGIYAFTARPGSVTSIHTDGDTINGPLPWRLAFYAEGQPGVLSWYEDNNASIFSDHSKAYIYRPDLQPVYSKKLDMPSAFVRTDIPHMLDISETSSDRLTITATFLPRISWQELNSRLDEAGHG